MIWHDSRKVDLLKQFIDNVKWGDLDYLIVDTPPGSTDQLSAITKLINFNRMQSLMSLFTDL